MNNVSLTPVNQYDSEFCGSIPLNLINQIQAHGVLLVLDRVDLKIVQVSENIVTILNTPVQQFLNKKLDEFVSGTQVKNIREKIDQQNLKDHIPLNLQIITDSKKSDFSAVLHFKDDYVLLELEEIDAGKDQLSFLSIYQEIKYITAALKEAKDGEEIARIAATEIKRLSGFDRVMIYQFDAEWNGTVIAEAKTEDLYPYLNLRFPASDIPKQARDLYFKNPYRLIPNRDFVPARLIPVVNPITRTFTDLSECALRSVPAVHIEYLRNMQVAASMSTAIIINNSLWGLISCHHKTPKFPDFEMRSAFELLADIIAVQLMSKERECKLQFRSRIHNVHAKVLTQLFSQKDLVTGLLAEATYIQELLNIDGLAFVFDGNIKTTGTTPNPEQLWGLVHWLQMYSPTSTLVTDTLPGLFGESILYGDIASGLLALPIDTRKGSYVLGFRPEITQVVEWGGNPNEAINFEPDGKTYHPRNSFATWKETVKHKSAPWRKSEMEAAEVLRSLILEKIIRDKT
jgi:light-regulated signal transduction histidine kinase (bacteriophytochrome)